jgi:hypothetical protein
MINKRTRFGMENMKALFGNVLLLALVAYGTAGGRRRQETAPDHLGRLRAGRGDRAVQAGDRHPGGGDAVEQRGNHLQAARHRRRRLRPGAAVAGSHHRRAARIRHLQADRPEPGQDRTIHPGNTRGHAQEHHAGRQALRTALPVGCRRAGGQHQVRQGRRLSGPVPARTSRARPRCGCAGRC